MDWKYLFLRFDGRISRQPYWIAFFIVLVAYFGLVFTILSALGLDFDALAAPSAVGVKVNLAVTFLLLYPSLAYMIKRLHDRNRTGWWAVLTYGLAMLADLADFAGFGGTQEEPGLAMLVIWVPMLAIALWLFVELGFFKGTQGPNRFGPDPLGAIQADASL